MRIFILLLVFAACNSGQDSDNIIQDYIETPKEQAFDAADRVESQIKDVHDQFKELEDY